MRRLFEAIGLIVLIVVAAPTAGASAAGGHRLTQIASPRAGQIVGDGHVRVVVRSRAALGAIRITVNGRNVTRYFHRSAGAYRATLRLGRGLYPGVEDLYVETDAYKDFDHVAFIVARRSARLVSVTSRSAPGDGAPAGVTVTTGTQTTLRAWVNGHRDDGAFEPVGSRYVGRLGANDWLRAGRNRVTVLAYRTRASGRSALYETQSRTFALRRGALTAGAGPDRFVDGGDFTVLHGSAVDLGSRPSVAAAISYRWRIVRHPRGRPAILTQADSAAPGFLATAPGYYLVQVTATGPGGEVSTDTATVAVRADSLPIGLKLDTASDDRGTIRLNGAAVPNTTCQDHFCPTIGFATYAVFNRQTLQLMTSGTIDGGADRPMMRALADVAQEYNRAPTYLMVVNLSGMQGISADARRLLNELGAGNLQAPPVDNPRPVSIVGVPGSPQGSAFVSDQWRNCQCRPPADLANMPGYLRLNPVSTHGDFEFVRTGQVGFNTDADPAANRITMKVGVHTYTHAVPTDGAAGFFVVFLHSHSLAFHSEYLFVTNRPDRSVNEADERRMADVLGAAWRGIHGRGNLLVLLQSFGHPRGAGGAWLEASNSIVRLGGDRELFSQMNQGLGDSPHQGRYAFVGRAPAGDQLGAQSSQSVTGRAADGKLHGLLARGRDDQYLPLIADSAGPVNYDLVHIVNRPSPPGGGFPTFTGGEATAADVLAREIMGICPNTAPTCDVRKAYHELWNGWGAILNSLASDRARRACDNGGSEFTPEQCNAVREQFEDEIRARNLVQEYFGREGLQGPFGVAQGAGLVDVGQIAEEIRSAVAPPPSSNATSSALNLISLVVKIAGGAGQVIHPAISSVAGGLSAAFGLAAYLTAANGSPDLVGPTITTAASHLGAALYNRYQRVTAYFTTEAKIVMSDWTKMRQVATAVLQDPKWRLGDIATSAETLRLGTRQTIYQALLPVAYPMIYDLGTGITHAKQWFCAGRTSLHNDKQLFQRTGTGAELRWRYIVNGRIALMAVGGRHTVGSGKGAYVPAPPDSLTDVLFRDPRAPQPGGIGLYKLELYSEPTFHWFAGGILQMDGNRGFQHCDRMPNPPGAGG